MFKRVFLIVLLTSGLGWAQVADALISGRVYDERGLPLPNVKMTMRNLDTGRTWSVLTSDEGKYLASRLPLGDYRVEASLDRFATAIQNASLDIRNEARVDFMLRAAEDTHQESPTQYRGVQQSPTTPFASTGGQDGRFAVQLASYRTRPRAEGLRAMLEDVGYTAYVVISNVPPSGRYYRVRVGPFDTREEAKEIALNMQSRLSDLLPDFWIVSD
jgi:SPOR domain/Carboxypeptidase regulatory-like domain